MKVKTEKDIIEQKNEAYFIKRCKANGIWECKFTSGITGVPDRIAVKNGKVAFVELKRPRNGRPSARQIFELKILRNHGVKAEIAKNHREIDAIIDYLNEGSEQNAGMATDVEKRETDSC